MRSHGIRMTKIVFRALCVERVSTAMEMSLTAVAVRVVFGHFQGVIFH